MKKILGFILLVMLTACSDNAAVEQLKKDYPDVKKMVVELPDTVQERLAAPESVPFEPKQVQLKYAGEPPGDPKGDIIHTEFVYGNGKGAVLNVTTFHNEKTNFHDEGKLKTTKLEDGTKVVIETNSSDVKAIRWKKDDLYYGMMLMGSQFKMEDLLKAANSMEY
ncbi:hypothetical protein AWM68_02220 [Fictibacillus phosphorivorans]|uniref:DUF4367 domain-containing protein n=1 Tax=Fictibacillus phosphorivorans TaxID=1221500 RepID=A0A163SHH8_9BACL|nr:hypothetical protein [Fictibacillus phosphorivorans]KZE69102.1 hypothetical protein AWM68_02220 [Fictibacillus phosphorivorans]